MGLIDYFLDRSTKEDQKSALANFARSQFGQDTPYAQLAQDPETFSKVIGPLLQKQMEGNAIQQYYGGGQQQSAPQASPATGGDQQPDAAVPQSLPPAQGLSQVAPQQPQGNNLSKLAAIASLPPALQQMAAQQMMFQGGGNSAVNSDLHGDDFLKTLSPTVASTVKAYSEGRMPVPTGGRNNSQFQALQPLIEQYDPSFDAVNYQARAKTRQDFTAGKSAQTVNALNTVAQHVAALKDASDALNNGDYPAVNKVANFYGQQTGNDAKTNFDNIVGHVSEELTKAYRGAGGAESDISREMENLSSSSSPKQFQGAFSKIGELLQGKIDAMQEQYKQGMGTAGGEKSFYSPQAQQAFQKIGVDVGQAQPQASTPSALSQVAAPKIYVNPQTGQRITKQNGQWVPVQ